MCYTLIQYDLREERTPIEGIELELLLTVINCLCKTNLVNDSERTRIQNHELAFTHAAEHAHYMRHHVYPTWCIAQLLYSLFPSLPIPVCPLVTLSSCFTPDCVIGFVCVAMSYPALNQYNMPQPFAPKKEYDDR